MSGRTWLPALVAVLTAAGCDRAGVAPQTKVPDGFQVDIGRQAEPATAPAVARSVAAPARGAGEASQGGTALAAMQAARKLIRTGQITLQVERYEEAAARVAAIAESHGGYVAESQAARGPRDRQHGTVTVRVPAERFASAFAALLELGEVKAQATSTQDVTKEYSDLETRLRVKRATADRLREILRTRTARLSDVLEAERELARVTEEIEGMEGERRFYDQQVALSTIAVALHEPEAVMAPGVFSPLSQALRDSLGVLAHSLAGLVYAVVFAVPWLLVGLLVWRVVRVVRHRRAVRATAS